MKRCFLFLFWLISVMTVHSRPFRVLFISSYHPGFPTYRRQLDGIRSAFPPGEVVLDEEFMDTKRLGWDNAEPFHESLAFKLQRLDPYNLIICADDNALVFLQKFASELFPGTPYVFLGINDIRNGLSENGNPLSTGVLEKVSFEETVRLILEQFPESQDLIVISDGTSSGKADLASFLSVMGGDPPLSLKIVNLDEYTFEEMEALLDETPERVPLLLLSAYRDRTGETLSFSDSFRRIYSHARGPVYHLWEHGFGEGAFGGYVVDHFYQGKEAGELAWRILTGDAPESLPVINISPNHYLFDYRELKRWGITRRSLPDDSLIIADPRQTRERQRRLTIILLFSTAVLFMLTLTFVRLNGRLKTINIALRESKDRFEYLFRYNPISFLIINPTTGAVKDANQSALDFYGYHINELSIMNIFNINQLTKSEIHREMSKAQKEKRNYFIFRHQLKNGDIRDVEVYSAPIKLDDGTYLLSAIHDISEKSRLQKELIQQEKENALGFLAGGIAHDFNNLLTGIIGYCDLIQMEECDESINGEYFDMILQSAVKAKDLTQNILTYSRNQNKRKTKISLRQIILDCLAEHRNLMPADIRVLTEFSGDGIIKANAGEIKQVMYNLIRNALHAMHEREGRLFIRLKPFILGRASQSKIKGLVYGSYQIIEVEDQGVGIPPDTVNFLFDPYFSTKKMEMGTGLGLALVKSIVDELEGIIQVESIPEQGTLFRIYLPSAKN